MELSHFELKYCSSHYSARPEKNIPIHKNTFEPEAEGTYISNTSISNGQPVKGISHIENITLITLEGPGMIGVTGSSRRLLKYYHRRN
jgi:aspartokinase/homoserine dehydrogenase 1